MRNETHERKAWVRWRRVLMLALASVGVVLWDGPRRRAEAEPAASAVFQPAFHEAIRWSTDSPRATYRMKVPLGRAGPRVRISFRAGDGSLHLYAATIAPAGKGGALAGPPVALTFNGEPGHEAKARERFTSDPVSFPVTLGEEVYVSFEVEGALASSSIGTFPDSFVLADSHAADEELPDAREYKNGIGLDTIDVEGPPGRAVVAIGDSITEGYSYGEVDDYRLAWPAVAQKLLGFPVVPAAVSSQVVKDELDHLDAEVFPLQGITDCVVLIGTNDLGDEDAPAIEGQLEALFARLRPFCQVWAGTLLPKERTSQNTLEVVNARRQDVNAWIRTQAKVAGVIDFEAALRRSDDPNRFQDGLVQDGIHPTFAGQQVMGQAAARTLGAPPPGTTPQSTTTPPSSGPVDDPTLPATVAEAGAGAHGCGAGAGGPELLGMLAAGWVLARSWRGRPARR